MKPLEALFALLKQFVPFPPGRYEKLFGQAANWEEETKKEDGNGAVKKALLYTERWYIQVLCAIVFMFGVKSVAKWMMTNEDPNMMDEEDFDEDDVAPSTGKRFNLTGM